MSNVLIRPFGESDNDLLKDESRLVGNAVSLSYPSNTSEVVEVITALEEKTKITVQGARTGLAGAAVPYGGHVLNMTRANKITGLRKDEQGTYYVKCQPGVLLSHLNEVLATKEFNTMEWTKESLATLEELNNDNAFFFPPDPTEKSATIGGMIACNASGARTLRYGPVRPWVSALKVVLANGDAISLKRGTKYTIDRDFALLTDADYVYAGQLPKYVWRTIKNAAGYYITPNMDLIDLFIGSEGTLGIITEVELRLSPLPDHIVGLTTFWGDEDRALKFVENMRNSSVQPAALEFFGHNALELLRKEQHLNPAFTDLQELPQIYHTAVYVEIHATNTPEREFMLESAAKIISECGGDTKQTWLALNTADMEQLKFFRHAVPEIVNLTIDRRRRAYPNLTKLGTDMAVPDRYLHKVMEMYRADLEAANLEHVIFGHIGNNHVHVNIMPRNMDEYEQGKNLYMQWAKQVIAWDGTISAEHGIGKFKRKFLQIMYTENELADMQELKSIFDPKNCLNAGNLFEAGEQ